MRWALKYARQLRRYLIVKAGMDRKNILALSEGETNPIDNNDLKSGRKANRRLEVKISLDGNE